MFNLFLKFLKLGFISFGGGYAVIPLLYDEISDIWRIPRIEFANLVGLFELTPGSLSVNAAGYVGYQAGNIPGAVLSTLGIILPSFLFMLVISAMIRRFEESEVTAAVIGGVRPAAMGITISSLLFFVGTSVIDAAGAPQTLRDPLPVSLPALLIAVLSYIGAAKKKINPIWIILCAGILGIVMG